MGQGDGLDGDRMPAGMFAEFNRLDLSVRAFQGSLLLRLAKCNAQTKRGDPRVSFHRKIHARSNKRKAAVV